MPRTETLQSTNRYVCSRHSTMHPVRPGGTRTTDSSSPVALAHPSIGGIGPRRATPASAHCGVDEHSTDGCSSAARRPRPHRRAYPYGGRSIRQPGAPLTYPRSEIRGANAGNPLFTLFLVGPRGCFEAPVVVWSRDISVLGALTRRCSIRFCHRYYVRARSRRSSSSLDPKCSLAGTTANRHLRAARECPREETPFAGVIHVLAVFPVSPTNQSSERRRALDTRHLSSSRSGARARGDAR